MLTMRAGKTSAGVHASETSITRKFLFRNSEHTAIRFIDADFKTALPCRLCSGLSCIALLLGPSRCRGCSEKNPLQVSIPRSRPKRSSDATRLQSPRHIYPDIPHLVHPCYICLAGPIVTVDRGKAACSQSSKGTAEQSKTPNLCCPSVLKSGQLPWATGLC